MDNLHIDFDQDNELKHNLNPDALDFFILVVKESDFIQPFFYQKPIQSEELTSVVVLSDFLLLLKGEQTNNSCFRKPLCSAINNIKNMSRIGAWAGGGLLAGGGREHPDTSSHSYQNGNLESDYFTLRMWALNLQT